MVYGIIDDTYLIECLGVSSVTNNKGRVSPRRPKSRNSLNGSQCVNHPRLGPLSVRLGTRHLRSQYNVSHIQVRCKERKRKTVSQYYVTYTTLATYFVTSTLLMLWWVNYNSGATGPRCLRNDLPLRESYVTRRVKSKSVLELTRLINQ